MRIGLGLGITGTGSAGEPPVITATSAPTMAALDDSQTPADGFTAGSYQSSEGTISSAVVAYLVNGSPQAGTFDLTAGDVVSATETVTDSAANERVFSTGSVVVTPSVALANSAAPVVSGSAVAGNTLTTTDGTWTGSASRTYSYQWTRDGSPISGETASTYTSVTGDIGSAIGCTVTADDGFTTVPADSNTVTITAEAAFEGDVMSEMNGQSNVVGTNNIDGLLDLSLQGQYDRVQLVDSRYLNAPVTYDEWEVLQLAETGVTVDGVVGKVAEFGAPNGISALSGRGVLVNDTAAGSDYLPDVAFWRALKNGSSGTPQTNWIPDGGGFNTSDAIMRQMVAPHIAGTTTRFSDFCYGQGEAEAEDVKTDAETAAGSTDPALVIPEGIDDARLTGFGAVLADIRRAKRGYFGIDTIPYIIMGVVLPDRDGGQAYDDNAERFREVLTTQYRNVARYAVRLSEDELSVTITDLGTFDRSIAYDDVADTFSETVTGTASTLKDDATYWIDARGWNSPDSLHHGVSAQLKMGKAIKLLLESLWGAGGVPPASHEVSVVKPIFYVAPTEDAVTDTSATLTFMPSEACTAHIAAYTSGSPTPTAAQVVAGSGTGYVASDSVAASRRTTESLAVGGLTAETDYDIYMVLDYDTGNLSVVSPAVSVTTAETVADPWTLVGSTTAQLEAFAVAGDTQAVTLPGSVAEGDIVMVFIAADGGIDQNVSNQGVSTSGYTQEYNVDTGNPGAYFGRKVLSASPESNVEIFLLDGKRQAVVVQVWRGVDTTTPLDIAIVESLANGANPDPDSATTVTAGARRFVAFFMDDDDAATGVTAPSGYTNLAVEETSLGVNPGAQGGTVGVASKLAGVVGAEDPGPFTTSADDAWRCIHFALRPAP